MEQRVCFRSEVAGCQLPFSNVMFSFSLLTLSKLFQLFVPFKFYSPVLKPNFHLGLGQVELFGYFLSFFADDVVIPVETFLQSFKLFS